MTDAPADIVCDFIDAWNRRDRAAIEARLHPDARVQGVPGPEARGREAAMALIDPFLSADEIDWRIVHLAVADRVVMTERVDRFRFGDRPAEVQAMGIFELDVDGLITAWRDYFDPTAFAFLADEGVASLVTGSAPP